MSEAVTREYVLDGMLRNLVLRRSTDGTYVGVGTTPAHSSGASTIELPIGGAYYIGEKPIRDTLNLGVADGIVEDGGDLNSYISPGVFQVDSSYTIANKPSGAGGGIVRVWIANGQAPRADGKWYFVLQAYIDIDGNEWRRRGNSGNSTTFTWQSWRQLQFVYRYRLLFTSANGAKFVPANNSTSTNATAARSVCQSKIDPFGAIVYYGTTASVAAGSRPSASYLWQQYAFSLGYSFNVAGGDLTLTAWKPVYVMCAPQTDGSAIIDSATPIVQALPSTEDGKIYVFLGVAYSATNVELLIEHPVYYFKDGAIRLWTNAESGLPAVTASDNGKILKVVNGAWAAATLNVYNGGVS